MHKALYAGSFDPLTNGHMDLIERASRMCDEVVVGVITNPSKVPLFTIDERVNMITESVSDLKNVKVVSFTGLLADYVNKGNFDIVLRGLRSNMDFEYEIQMAHMNARLYEGNVETIFVMTNPQNSFISSSMIKEVCSLGGNIDGLVPENILIKLKEKYSGGK